MADSMPSRIVLHELVYGSAAKLLVPGASDLGVIASTKGFPQDASRWLASHRAYTGDGTTGGSRPVKYIAGRLGRYLEVSRIEMGADHTGRALPFTHHVLIEETAARSGGVSAGALLRSAASACRDPRTFAAGWIDPPSAVASDLTVEWAKNPLPSNIVAAIAFFVMRYQADKRPVVLVAPRPTSADLAADPFLSVIALVADVLPADGLGGLVAVTHAIEKGDRLADASILCTYPDTPLHREYSGRSDSRAPLVVDCSSGRASAVAPSNDPFVLATIADLKAGRPGQFATLCDRFGAKSPQYDAVAELARAEPRFVGTPTLATLEGLIVAKRKCGGVGNRTRLEEWLFKLIEDVLRSRATQLIDDTSAQRDGHARLAKALSVDDSLLRLLGRVGAKAEVSGKFPIAESVAQSLLTLGVDGKEVGRAAADLEKSPVFRARFDDARPPEPVPSVTEGVTGPRPLSPRPLPLRKTQNQPPRGVGGIGARSWSRPYQSSASGGGRWVPFLATIVAVVAFIMPVIQTFISMNMPVDARAAAKFGGGAAKPSASREGLLVKQGHVKTTATQMWSAIKRRWDQSANALIGLAVLVVIAVVLFRTYGPLTNWLVNTFGEVAAYLPMLLAVGIAFASAGLSYVLQDSKPGDGHQHGEAQAAGAQS